MPGSVYHASFTTRFHKSRAQLRVLLLHLRSPLFVILGLESVLLQVACERSTGYVCNECASSAAFHDQPFRNQVAVSRSMTSSTFRTSRRQKPKHEHLRLHIPHSPMGLPSTPCHLPTSLHNHLVPLLSLSLKALATVQPPCFWKLTTDDGRRSRLNKQR